MASRTTIAKHYSRLHALWPADPLRPELQFHSLLQSRATRAAQLSDKDAQAALLSVNALYSLVEGRYAKRYRAHPLLLHPPSNPSYYDDLVRNLREIPNRSWLAAQARRLAGMFRWS